MHREPESKHHPNIKGVLLGNDDKVYLYCQCDEKTCIYKANRLPDKLISRWVKCTVMVELMAAMGGIEQVADLTHLKGGNFGGFRKFGGR